MLDRHYTHLPNYTVLTWETLLHTLLIEAVEIGVILHRGRALSYEPGTARGAGWYAWFSRHNMNLGTARSSELSLRVCIHIRKKLNYYFVAMLVLLSTQSPFESIEPDNFF